MQNALHGTNAVQVDDASSSSLEADISEAIEVISKYSSPTAFSDIMVQELRKFLTIEAQILSLKEARREVLITLAKLLDEASDEKCTKDVHTDVGASNEQTQQEDRKSEQDYLLVAGLSEKSDSAVLAHCSTSTNPSTQAPIVPVFTEQGNRTQRISLPMGGSDAAFGILAQEAAQQALTTRTRKEQRLRELIAKKRKSMDTAEISKEAEREGKENQRSGLDEAADKDRGKGMYVIRIS